jgi:phosphoglucosamine mutase
MTRLFGTDGIRGRALEAPLDEATVRALGHTLAEVLCQIHATPRLLLAGDTRASTPVLAQWLGGSFQAAGGLITWGEVLPTPAVSHLLRSGEYAAGVVISASHNPAHDNGIKILGPSGEKIADETERSLEGKLASANPSAGPQLPAPEPSLADHYLDQVCATHQTARPLDDLHVVVDAAHGAASGLAGQLFERLGARVTAIAASPDGTNINAGCGATSPELVASTVRDLGADCGLALDGDADRAMVVNERGELLDGDDILLVWARHLAAAERLPGRRVVATVMSNYGLESALVGEEMELIRCAVGDRQVWLAMRFHDAALGGEQSGHIICSHHTVSGDGLITGSHVLAIAAARGLKVSQLSDLTRLPQVLINVPVRHKQPFDQVPAISGRLDDTERSLKGRGRVLLRYSGTEALARVMLEGEDATEIETLANELAEVIRSALG